MRVIKSIIAILIISAVAAGVIIYIGNQEKEISPVDTDASVIINEFSASNSGVLPDENGRYSDWIEIYNPSDSPVALSGFGLSDDNKKPRWTFPGITLKAKGYVVIFASGADISKADAAYQHTNFKLSSSGGGVYLFNAAGELADKIEYKQQTENVSYGRTAENLTELIAFERPTPGFSNDEAGYEAFKQSRIKEGSELLITEVNPSNSTSFADNKGNLSDYIEIHNAGAQAVNLSGYGLSDDPDKVMKWRFPEVTIEQGAYLVVFASGEDENWTDLSVGAVHTSFRISTYRETIVLSDTAGYILDSVELAEIPPGNCYARVYSGGAYQRQWELSAATPGSVNGGQ